MLVITLIYCKNILECLAWFILSWYIHFIIHFLYHKWIYSFRNQTVDMKHSSSHSTMLLSCLIGVTEPYSNVEYYTFALQYYFKIYILSRAIESKMVRPRLKKCWTLAGNFMPKRKKWTVKITHKIQRDIFALSSCLNLTINMAFYKGPISRRQPKVIELHKKQ